MTNKTDFKNMLDELFRENKIIVTKEALDKFDIYKDFLLEYNEIVNLTAITEPREIAIKHFMDSISILNEVNIAEGSKVIDIGTGAGFPGVPLKIVRDDIKLTLLDSLNKRLVFLDKLCRDKISTDVNIIHARAEDCDRIGLRSGFDFAVSRAVAPLNILLELCIPYVVKGGFFVAMKGSKADEETRDSKNAALTLNCEIVKLHKFKLSDDINRTIVVIQKKEETPKKYPRLYSKIKKSPL